MIDKITVNAQSSIRIGAGKVIYFDPYMIKNEVHDADVIFFTHPHPDHFSPDDFAKVAKEETIFVAPRSMEDIVLKAGVEKEKLIICSPEERYEVAAVAVESVPAYNILKPMHPKKNGWLGYVITVENTCIYVCGDTDAIPEGENVKCDIAMVPIGGTFTMSAKKAADFVNEMQPQIVIPIHYGTIVGTLKDAETFKEMVKDSIKVCTKL